MFLMKYFIIFATVAMITEIVSFSLYITTIVKETDYFVPITNTTVFMAKNPAG